MSGPIAIVHPAASRALGGNRVTALRWAGILRRLGWRPFVEGSWSGRPCEVMVALHAARSHDSIRRFRDAHPTAPLIVACTGTDIYGEGAPGELAIDALDLATRIVVLQPLALDSIPSPLRARAVVVYQSVHLEPSPEGPPADSFDACVIAHLRPVKDPLLAAAAARRAPARSRLRVRLLGAALDEDLGRQAEREATGNPRFEWLGPQPRRDALCVMARSHVLVSSSRHEGGANTVTEAFAAGVPVLATDVPGSRGLLGDDHPGLFAVGDAGALADLLGRAETDAGFLAELRRRSLERRELADPERELESWREMLSDLFDREAL